MYCKYYFNFSKNTYNTFKQNILQKQNKTFFLKNNSIKLKNSKNFFFNTNSNLSYMYFLKQSKLFTSQNTFFNHWLEFFFFKTMVLNIFKKIFYFFLKNYNFLMLKRWIFFLIRGSEKLFNKTNLISFISIRIRSKIGVTNNKRKTAILWKKGTFNDPVSKNNYYKNTMFNINTITGSISLFIVIKYIH